MALNTTAQTMRQKIMSAVLMYRLVNGSMASART